MKQSLSTPLVAAALALAASSAQAQVGVSVSVQQPGVYGRIDIGNAPPPPVVYARPVVIQRPVVVAPAEPVYLYVPPGHQKKWSKHCHRYNACGQPVYFVKESWVRERYEHEHPHDHRHDDHHHGKGHGKGHGKDHKH